MSAKYAIGLDYGTNSVRALVVDTAHGREAGTSVWNYEHGTQGVILGRDPNLARQHPADYVKGAEVTIRQALAAAKKAVSWIYGGGAHHTGFSQALTAEHLEDFAEIADLEYLLIGKDASVSGFKKELRSNEVYYALNNGLGV